MRNRIENADRTTTLTGALKALEATNFQTWMGSGVMIRITPITEDRNLCDEFLIPAECMDKIKEPLIGALLSVLSRRKVILQSEIREIEKSDRTLGNRTGNKTITGRERCDSKAMP